MARPTVTFRSSIYSTSNNASPYQATTSWTPAANSMIVALVCNQATTPPDPTSVSAHGVSLTQVGATLALSTTHKLTIWVGDAGGSPTNAAASATVSGTPTGCVVIEFEVTNWNTAKTAVNAIRTTNSATGTATSGSVPVWLDAQTVNESGYISFFVHLANETTTGQGGNWTQTAGAVGNYNTPPTGASGQHNNTGYTATATASWTTSSAYAGIVIEIQGTTDSEPSDALKISDTVTPSLNPEEATPAENLKVVDTLTASIPLERNVTGENLKINDTGRGVVQLIGTIHVTDSVSAALVVDTNLSASLLENLKLSDAVVADENPLDVSLLTENLKLSDTVSAFIPSDAFLFDTFTAVSDTELSLHSPEQGGAWTKHPNFADDITIDGSTDYLKGAAGTGSIYYNAAAPGGADYSVSCDIFVVSNAAPSYPGCVGRIDTAASTFYIVYYDQSAGGWILQKYVTGTVTQLGSTYLQTLTDSQTYTVKLEMIGTAIKVYIDGVERISVTDGAVTAAGKAGVSQFSNAGQQVTTVNATAVVSGLQASLAEALKISDSVSADENPRDVALLSENLRIADSVTANQGLTASLSENLKISDTVSADENPRDVSLLTDALKISDALTASRGLDVSVAENLKLSDTVSADENPRPVAIQGESLKITDSLSANQGLSASLTENLKLSDVVTADENPRDLAVTTESLKLSDTVTVSMGLLANVSESLKISDAVIADENPRDVSLLSESLKIVDTLTTSGGLSVSVAENLSVVDQLSGSESQVELVKDESLLLSDSLSAQLSAGVNVSEAIRITDTITATLNPEETSLTESLKLSDSLTVTRVEAGELTVSVTENLKISDTITADKNPRPVAVTSENLKLSDSVTTRLNPQPVLVGAENLKISDALTVSFGLAQTIAENLKLSDQVTTSLSGLQTSASEALRIIDTTSVTLNPLEVSLNEGLRLSDVLQIVENPLEPAIGESLRIQDEITAAKDLLSIQLSEDLKIVEDLRLRLFNIQQTVGVVHLEAMTFTRVATSDQMVMRTIVKTGAMRFKR